MQCEVRVALQQVDLARAGELLADDRALAGLARPEQEQRALLRRGLEVGAAGQLHGRTDCRQRRRFVVQIAGIGGDLRAWARPGAWALCRARSGGSASPLVGGGLGASRSFAANSTTGALRNTACALAEHPQSRPLARAFQWGPHARARIRTRFVRLRTADRSSSSAVRARTRPRGCWARRGRAGALVRGRGAARRPRGLRCSGSRERQTRAR